MRIKKNVKKIISVVLTFALIVTSVTIYSKKVTRAEETLESMVANENGNYNLAKGGEVSYLNTHSDGAGTTPDKITDGSFSTAHCAINDANDNWGGEGSETYVVVDLGKTYEAENIDKIVVGYKDGATNDTVLSRSYSISYSSDGETYSTVIDNRTVSEFDNKDINATIDDVKGTVGNVRWIKIYYPVTAEYGMQIKEIAVLDTDLDVQQVTVESIANPKDFTAIAGEGTDVTGQITVKVVADEKQEDFWYAIYLDGVKKTVVSAEQDYVITGIKKGQHEVKVISVYKGAESEGIIKTVVVPTIEDKVTDINMNVAYGKEYEIFRTDGSNESAEGNGNITNGIIDGNDYITAEINTEASYFTIDLKDLYVANTIDKIVVWFRSYVGGTWPEQGGFEIRYSKDNTAFENAATITQEEFNSEREKQGIAPFGISIDVSTTELDAVRYVQIYFPEKVGYGAQLTEVGIFDMDGDLEEAVRDTYTVTIDDVANEVGSTYKLPENDNVKAYYEIIDGKFYKPNTEINVNKNLEFVTVNEITVNLTNGAAIRIDAGEQGGIRFRAKVSVTCGLDSKKDDIINSIQSGMLITTKDILENADNAELTVGDMDAIGTVLKVENSGWYNDETGLYCASLIKILEANYDRTFVARAYVEIPYTIGNEYIYSDGNGTEYAKTVERDIKTIAGKIIKNASVFNSYTQEQQNAIKKFAGLE